MRGTHREGNLEVIIGNWAHCRDRREQPPYSEEVGEINFKAPEHIFKSTSYFSGSDVFSVGIIMAGLYYGESII